MLKQHLSMLVKKNKDIQDLFSFLSETVRENKKNSFYTVATLVGLSALSSFQPVFLQFLTNAAAGVISTGTITAAAVTLAIGYGVLEVSSNFVNRLSFIMINWVKTRFGNKVIEKNMHQVFKMPRLAQKEKTAPYLAEVLMRASRRGQSVLETASRALINFGSFAISSTILLAASPVIALSLIGVTAIKIGMFHQMNKRFEKSFQTVAQKLGKNSARIRDVLEKAAFVRTHNKEKAEMEAITLLNQNAQQKIEKVQKKRLKLEALMKIVDLIGSLAITLPAIYTAMKTGDLGAYFLVTGSAYHVLYGGSAAANDYSTAQENYLSYRQSMKELEYDKSLEPLSGTKTLEHCSGNISFENVSFCYPGQEKPLLNGLNLQIHKGERLVIIGKTGSGKTTLINLLKHEMEITNGQIKIDGTDIRELQLEDLNRQISYVEQKPDFLKRSIRENLRLVKPDASWAEMEDCMKKAGLHEEIMSLAAGYDALPNMLSGGQQQRLAIAQAFLKESPIVLMDEPTSALDRYTARTVLDTILAFGEDKTLILISHNPAEIAKADRAVLLSNGKIIEDGTPQDLIAQRGYFYGLYKEELEFFRGKKKKNTLCKKRNTLCKKRNTLCKTLALKKLKENKKNV